MVQTMWSLDTCRAYSGVIFTDMSQELQHTQTHSLNIWGLTTYLFGPQPDLIRGPKLT
jgi:hypothetical protein